MPCPYTVLEVGRDADEEEILASYRRLAILFHPDRNLHNHVDLKHNPDLSSHEENVVDEDSFILLSQSYEILIDPQTRRRYHTHLSNLQNEENLNAKTTVEQVLKSAKACINPEMDSVLNEDQHITHDIYMEAMLRSRDRRPFMDARVLFSSIFGSDIFGDEKLRKHDNHIKIEANSRFRWGGRLRNRLNTAIYHRKLAAISVRNKILGKPTSTDETDSSHILPQVDQSVSTRSFTNDDGTQTIVKITKKIVGEKQMTKTETTICSDLPDGSKKTETFVEVTSEEISSAGNHLTHEVDKDDNRNSQCDTRLRTKVHHLVKKCTDCVVAPCIGDPRGTLSQVD